MVLSRKLYNVFRRFLPFIQFPQNVVLSIYVRYSMYTSFCQHLKFPFLLSSTLASLIKNNWGTMGLFSMHTALYKALGQEEFQLAQLVDFLWINLIIGVGVLIRRTPISQEDILYVKPCVMLLIKCAKTLLYCLKLKKTTRISMTLCSVIFW